MGGVGGGDVRGDGHTNDVGAAAEASSTAAYLYKYSDERTNNVGAAAAASSNAAYHNKYGDERTNNVDAAAVAQWCDVL